MNGALWAIGHSRCCGSSSCRKPQPAHQTKLKAKVWCLPSPTIHSELRSNRKSFGFTKKPSRRMAFFVNGALWAIRTPDPQLRRLLLYPAELRAQHQNYKMVGTGGFEPSASCSQSKRSTRLSYVPSLATTDKITALFYFASVFFTKISLKRPRPLFCLNHLQRLQTCIIIFTDNYMIQQ